MGTCPPLNCDTLDIGPHGNGWPANQGWFAVSTKPASPLVFLQNWLSDQIHCFHTKPLLKKHSTCLWSLVIGSENKS